MTKPILYTTGCPKCKVVSTKLSRAGVEYEICDDIEVMKSKGFTYMPMLEADGKVMDFAEILKWVGGLK